MSPVDDIAFQARIEPKRLAALELATGRSWSYAALHPEIGRWAAALLSRDVQAGDRVAALARNCMALVALHHACARIGAIYAPLNWRLGEREIEGLLADAEPTLLLTDGDPRGESIAAFETHALGIEPAETPPIDPERPSLILYTSGTTGRPKGVLLSERAIGETAANMGRLGRVTHDSRFLCDSPMFHVIGLVTTIRPAFRVGAAVLLSDGFDAERTLGRLSDPELNVTHYFCVPQMAAALRTRPEFDPTRLRHLTALFTGGAPNPPADIQAWAADGIPVANGFGMSESGTVCHTGIDLPAIDAKAGSVGVPTPGVQVRVADGDGIVLPPGEAGELQLRGPNLFSGYWRRPDETAAAFTSDGWFRTGDIARVDADGSLWIVDRAKDMFISGGENVYPAEIEAALAGHPQVAECAVVGVPDERWGEVGHLAIRPRAESLDVAAVQAFLGERLARYKLPKHVSIVEELPRNGAGKVLKIELRRLLLSQA